VTNYNNNVASEDEHYMRRAIEIAKKGQLTASPNPIVGCVIVKNNNIVGEGSHLVTGEKHAEIHALNSAGEHAKNSTVYLTLEPCSHHGSTPPCVESLIGANIARAVVSMIDPDPRVSGKGVEQLKNKGVVVELGLMEHQARDLNKGYISRMINERPYITIKLAMSLDGRTALASGDSKWITSKAARHDVHFFRAKADAIVTTASTIAHDNPMLNVRLSKEDLGLKNDYQQPLKVIFDKNLDVETTANIFQHGGKNIFITLSEDKKRKDQIENLNSEVACFSPDKSSRIPIPEVFSLLATKFMINEVFVEAGPKFCGSLIEAKIVDELLIYMAPKLLGADSMPLFDIIGCNDIEKATNLDMVSSQMVGQDMRISMKVRY